MKILIPTDFSITAGKALQYAFDCFQEPDTTFILYHSFMPYESGFYNREKSEEENRSMEVELGKKLQRKADIFIRENPDAVIELFVDRGVDERGILRYAKKHEVDLIIMGTTGATGVKEKLIGSVTAEVISKSDCPVIGIPEKYEPRPLKEIAFCSNYQLRDIDALKYLRQLAKKFQADIQIWHFHKKEANEIREQKLAEDYKTMVLNILGDKKITFHFSDTDSIQNALDELSARGDLDMIAMITHRRKGFLNHLLDKSLTKQVAHHTEIPLLAIPYGC